MKKGAVEIYKSVVIWVSLILIIWGLIEHPLTSNFSNAAVGSISWWVVGMILPSIFGLILLTLLAYSMIMLVYILAKRLKEEYIFGFAVPILLFGISFLLDNIRFLYFIKINQVFFLAILFLYSLYHKWNG